MHNRSYFLLIAVIAAVAAVLISICIGSYPLSLKTIADILAGQLNDTMEWRVFWHLRLPRVIMGLISGSALGLAGGVYQTIFRNHLASPDLTGVASGASFGAACAIVLGTGSTMQIMCASFFMGMLSLALVLLLVHFSRFEQTGSYILSGIIISSLADAGLMMLKILADPERELAAIEFWTMGSLASITAEKLLSQVLFILLPMLLLLIFYRQILILSLGSAHARSLGLSPKLWYGILLSLSTLMVVGVVAVTGVIAFVGLIAPHIAFLLYRKRNGSYFLLCALMGGVILLIADIGARSLAGGAELPLSVLTVLLAVPMLVLLLCGKKGGYHGAEF